MTDLTGKRIAIVATDYFEESELVEPLTQLRDMGAEVIVAAPHDDFIQALRHVEMGREVPVDTTIDKLDSSKFDAVVIPGGVVNADHLRIEKAAQEFVQDMADASKPVAAICHGAWLLVSSGLVRGRTLTSYHTLADDIINAGGKWVDQEVAVDGKFITSRKPDDIPAFVAAIIDALR
ncbi:MAG TPA: type 1 glutamine amidotransferase domain-containing protein [Candidatus Chromulinivoraceae bacterium]|nr:type 1 glutamine amidotransferase domain-containing protein [Candidatus Chromulinivoraceae bacterium]